MRRGERRPQLQPPYRPPPEGVWARPARFAARVVARLYGNHGLVLASAIAFDTLLSMVPLLALGLVALTHVVEPSDAERAISEQISLLLPGAAQPVTRAYAEFLEQRDLLGGVGMAGLVVFGAMAFRTAREAMEVLFGGEHGRRSSGFRMVLLPLLYVAITVIGLILSTALVTAVDALPEGGVSVLGVHVELAGASRLLLRLGGFVALLLLFSSFYWILPGSRARARDILLGGLVAASIWELTRRLLVWYFSRLSLVGAVYGSLASVVVLLVSLEVAAVVFLLGGQVVVELSRCSSAGLPWYVDPTSSQPAPARAVEQRPE